MITYGYSLPPSNERKRFEEEIALVRCVDKDPSGGSSGVPVGLNSIYYAIIYRKTQTVSPMRHVWSSFKFRHRP